MFSILLFHNRRFKKGMPFLYTTTYVNIATTISLLLVGFLIFIPSKRALPTIRIFTPFLFIIVLAILIYWWQTQLTKTYKRRLMFRELESLRTEVQEKDKLIAALMEQNQELGRLIHRDNKRIPAMENAVNEYLTSDFKDMEELKAKGQVLQAEIQQLSTSRTKTLADINSKRCKQYATGIPSLDALLNYMAKRAVQENIQLSVHMAVDLKDYIPKCIATEDFTHMLSDLLDNACIAVSYADERNIQLQFYVSEKAFILEIADSGIPFEAASLANFGLVQKTTHADTGGSGIGLMDIWRIKEKYGATLHIEEYDSGSPYTKKISFIFNKKNKYTIRTYRKEKIFKKIERIDLQIYDYDV